MVSGFSQQFSSLPQRIQGNPLTSKIANNSEQKNWKPSERLAPDPLAMRLPDREILTPLSQATEIIGGGAVAGNAEKHLPSLLSTGTALASLKGPSLRKVVKGTYRVTVGL